MRDEQFIRLLEEVKEELHDRFGRKICEELDSECVQCKAHILIGNINGFVDYIN